MNTTSLGRQAEAKATQKLTKDGYKIIDRNWRTRNCEIDIVAQKDGTIYFVEVKYRISNRQGDPAEFVTANKQKQMAFAAEMWVSQNDWPGDYQLAVVPVLGEGFMVGELILLG